MREESKRPSNNKDIEKLWSWSRYLYWADIQRKSFIDYNSEHESVEGAQAEWRVFARLSQWLASMWVVIEGWHQLEIADEIIDGLLKEWHHFCEFLRRYRNGVFHSQPKLLDERFHALVNAGSDFVMWVFAQNGPSDIPVTPILDYVNGMKRKKVSE